MDASDTRSYEKVDDHALTITNKTAGKVTTSGKITVSADGKSRRVTISGTDSSGKKVSSSTVYGKQ